MLVAAAGNEVTSHAAAPKPGAADPVLRIGVQGAKRHARSESPPGAPFVPRKRRTPAAGAHHQHAGAAAASVSVPASGAQHAPAAPVSGSLDGGEGTQSFLRTQPSTPSKARSGDVPDAWAARCKASSSVAGASSDIGSAHVPDLTIPIICGTACGALLTRPTPHFACNCRVCAAAPEAERLVFLSRNAFVTHLRDAGAFGNKKEGLLYVVQGDGSKTKLDEYIKDKGGRALLPWGSGVKRGSHPAAAFYAQSEGRTGAPLAGASLPVVVTGGATMLGALREAQDALARRDQQLAAAHAQLAREQGWVSALAAQLDQASALIGGRNLAIQALHAQLTQARALNQELAAAASAAAAATAAAGGERGAGAAEGGIPHGGEGGEQAARTLRLLLGQVNAALAERTAQIADITGQLAAAGSELASRDERLATAERAAEDAGLLREQLAKAQTQLRRAASALENRNARLAAAESAAREARLRGSSPSGGAGPPADGVQAPDVAQQRHFLSLTSVSPLECGLFKVSDIKQVLLLHGLLAAGKRKQELLNKMAGMTLFPPAQDVSKTPLHSHPASKDGQELSICLHTGRVVKGIGADHAADICPTGCSLPHAHALVRCLAQPLDKTKEGQGPRLDLKVDLHARLRISTPGALLALDLLALQDAWVQPGC
ncbi:hypothetical protein WJX81_000258 [Elliptochloris bilobata]|uniref:Uncharacterized protein n=1 Tax=Elliptochloris bilobata TaxID=381761 RepID=A0AAW1QYE6_9CHLO